MPAKKKTKESVVKQFELDLNAYQVDICLQLCKMTEGSPIKDFRVINNVLKALAKNLPEIEEPPKPEKELSVLSKEERNEFAEKIREYNELRKDWNSMSIKVTLDDVSLGFVKNRVAAAQQINPRGDLQSIEWLADLAEKLGIE